MAEKSKKTTSAEDMDVTANVRTLKKWLKSLKVKTELKVPNKDVPQGLRHGILFLDYLRCQNFPQAVTSEEQTFLNVISELNVKADPEGVSSSGELATQKSQKTKGKIRNENLEEPKPNKRVAGPKSATRKLVPLSDAMNKLNILDYKGCGCKGTCQTKICGCKKRDMQCGASCKCSEGCHNKGVEVVCKEETAETNENEHEMNEDGSDNDSEKSCDVSSSGDEDLEKVFWMNENVDWNEHIASLVKCPKCTRNFLPSRVIYHAKVCQNV